MHLKNWTLLISFFCLITAQANQCKKLLGDSKALGSSALTQVAEIPVLRGSYQVGIPTIEFITRASPEVLGRQRESNWCWAASLQMVMAHHGIVLPQEAIVERTYGTLINLTVDASQLVPTLSGWTTTKAGRLYTSVATQIDFPIAEYILDQLGKNQPLIAAISVPSGHVVVVTGFTYDINPLTNQLIPRSVIFRDPWPEHESKQELSWVEFQARFITMVGIDWVPI